MMDFIYLYETELRNIFRGNGFSFSPLSMMLAIGLSDIVFTMLRYIPSIPSFLRALFIKMVLNLIKAVFCPKRDREGGRRVEGDPNNVYTCN
jgi:hypothetical protein